MSLRKGCDEFQEFVECSTTHSGEGSQKENQMSDASENTVNRNAGNPARSQRDPSKPYNQTRPLSTRTSGTELDECCGSIGQSEAGMGLDEAIALIDRRKK
jgi:hypothetical protein